MTSRTDAAVLELDKIEVTKREEAVAATEAERQRFNDLLETLPAYLLLLSPDYHVPYANRFFRERFGESHGRRCFEYTGPEDVARAREAGFDHHLAKPPHPEALERLLFALPIEPRRI